MIRVFWIFGVSCVLGSVKQPGYEKIGDNDDGTTIRSAASSVEAEISECDSFVLLNMYKEVIDEVRATFQADTRKTLDDGFSVSDIVCGRKIALSLKMETCLSAGNCLFERNRAIIILITGVRDKLVKVAGGQIWKGGAKMSETDRKKHGDLILDLQKSLLLSIVKSQGSSVGLEAQLYMCNTLEAMSLKLSEIIALDPLLKKVPLTNPRVGPSKTLLTIKQYMKDYTPSKKLVFVLDISSQVLKKLYDFEESWGLTSWANDLFYDGSSVILATPTRGTSYANDVDGLSSMINDTINFLVRYECPKIQQGEKPCTRRLEALQASFNRMREYITTLSLPGVPDSSDAMPRLAYEQLGANIAELKQIWTGWNPRPSIQGPSSTSKVTPSKTAVAALWKAVPAKKRMVFALQAAETFLIDLKKANSAKCSSPDSLPLSLAYDGKNFWLPVPPQHYLQNLTRLHEWLTSQLNVQTYLGKFTWLSSKPSEKRMEQVMKNMREFNDLDLTPTQVVCEAATKLKLPQPLYDQVVKLISNMKANLNNWFDYENPSK